jgi:hypothetical protein
VIERQWHPGKVRPLQGNPPHDRPVSREIISLQERLRRSLKCHPCVHTEAPPYAFFEAWRNLSVRCGQSKTKPRGGHRLPPAGRPRAQVKERAGRITLFSSSAMSSGRLFLDQVGRHQSLSPLHRRPQNNTHSPDAQTKGDISTLLGGRHFYFALTSAHNIIDIDGHR